MHLIAIALAALLSFGGLAAGAHGGGIHPTPGAFDGILGGGPS